MNDKISLTDYINREHYTKSETWTQEEISSRLIEAITNIDVIETVLELPDNPKPNRLYFLINPGSDNKYDVYVTINNKWIKIDTFDFSMLDVDNISGLADIAKTGDYDDLSNAPSISDTITDGDYNAISSHAVYGVVTSLETLRDKLSS